MDDYRGSNYPEYLKTAHWHKLRDKFIDSNPKAECWISHKRYSLLPHHERYENLFHERLNRDIFILNYDYHTAVHFYKNLWGRTVKTPLTRRCLRKRRLLLRLQYVFKYEQKHRFRLTVWYLLRYLINF